MDAAHANVRGLLEKHGYAEVRTIGEGSFGKAILVQAKDGSKVVCKMVDVSRASARETRDAAKEGQLLASLKYPYVVRYRENFTESGWFCILMDYCRGGDLSMKIQQAKKGRAPIQEDQVTKWFGQATLALKYIHDRHILHRDLKPGNFFLSSSGRVKMGDFGIAKVLSCTIACARTQIGTPYYLSPEVCQERPYDWSSDVWAMGCLLYELCALKVPFDAPNISGLVTKICKGPIPGLPTSYSPSLCELGAQLLSRNATLRPSAEEILKRPVIYAVVKPMLDELQEHQSARPASAEPPPPPPPPLPLHLAAEGPNVPPGCGFRTGDLVEYHSNTHGDWLQAVILKVDAGGAVVIDLKPKTWMSKEVQEKRLRRRRPSSKQRPPSSGRDRASVAGGPRQARPRSAARGGGA